MLHAAEVSAAGGHERRHAHWRMRVEALLLQALSQVGQASGWSELAQRVWVESLEVCSWMAAGGAPGCAAAEATARKDGLAVYAQVRFCRYRFALPATLDIVKYKGFVKFKAKVLKGFVEPNQVALKV